MVFYCGYHEKMICVTCLGDSHKNCKSVKHLSSMNIQSGISSQGTESLSISELSTVITKLQSHIDSVIDVIKENDADNKKAVETIQTRIQETKEKVVRVLDAMEDDVNQKAKAMTKEITIKDLESIEDLKETAHNLKVYGFLMDKIATLVKPEQANICAIEAKNVVKEVKQKTIDAWSSFTKNGIQLKIEEGLEFIQNLGVNETSKLASLNPTETSVLLPAFHENEPNVKKIKVKQSMVYEIVPEGLNKDKDPEPTFSDIVFLENGHFLIIDSEHGSCSMVDKNMNIIGSYTPADSDENVDENDNFKKLMYASWTRNGTFAISIPSAMKIQFVTADKCLAYRGEITCKQKPMAVHVLSNNDIAVAWNEPVAFGILSGMMWSDEEVYFTMDKQGRILKSFEYIGVDETRGHVIQPCQVDQTVYCFSFSGQPVFQYMSEDLIDPRGVDLDNNQNIYICEKELSMIHVLFPTGHLMLKLKHGCPERPLAIGVDKKGHNFAVTQYHSNYWWTINFFSICTMEENEHIDRLDSLEPSDSLRAMGLEEDLKDQLTK